MRAFLVAVTFAGLLSPVVVACGSDGGNSLDGGDGSTDAPPACSANQTLCTNVCVDTSSDPNNCGSCSNGCLGGDLCCSGHCVKSSSCGFAVTGVNPLRGNQSGGDWLTLTGAGFTSDMAVYIGDGRAPTLVLDPQHARIQTPPDTVGTYDITLVSSQGTSLTRTLFQYVAAGVQLPWQKDPMQSIRGEMPGIAVMQDGRVLVAGGTTVPDSGANGLTTAEIFTRGAGTNSDVIALAANKMSIRRWHDAAVTTLQGPVIVAGGSACSADNCALADTFDPTTNSFTQTSKPMSIARSYMHGVLMIDGRVMLTSGGAATSEIYDPATDSFSAVPLVTTHQFGHQLVRLRDGRPMIIGGDGGQKAVEVFDVATNKWSSVASLKAGRSMFTAHTLPDGRVMVFGGASVSAGGVNVPMKEIEAYDPKQDTWTVMSYTLSRGRTWHASALVRDGTVLVMGGYTQAGSCAPSNTVDQVDPVAGNVTPFGTLPDPNTEWNAVTLLDGSVLGVGGGACGGVALPDLDFLPGSALPN